MILDLEKFLTVERPLWTELEEFLTRLEENPRRRPSLEEVKRLHYLHERAAAALGKLATFASEPATRRYLESLVARAHGEIHEQRDTTHRPGLAAWFFHTFPQTFRRHVRFFWFAVAVTLAGCLFGGAALLFDPDSRHVTMAFGHDELTPTQRVRQEEQRGDSGVADEQAGFSTFLMTHNTRVSVSTLAMGMTWGIGTIVLLFYNGVILGAISVDYIQDGQGQFLAGWILPHGSIELPAILIAGQAGLLLGTTLLGRGAREPLRVRMRAVSRDLMTLIFGVTLLLIWAGLVEGFFSQYHEPVLPYAVKITFGIIELGLLTVFLAKAGAGPSPNRSPASTQ